MLSSDLMRDIGTLIRSLQFKVQNEPDLLGSGELDAKDYLERAIIALIKVRLEMDRE